MTMALRLPTKRVARIYGVAKARCEQDDLLYERDVEPGPRGYRTADNRLGQPGRAVQMKVYRIPNSRMMLSNTTVVGIELDLRLIESRLLDRYLDPVKQWIALNNESLLLCNRGIGRADHRLQRTPA
jgi:hypothetical protein